MAALAPPSESQRDSSHQPKVARNALPWVGGQSDYNPEGVATSDSGEWTQPRWG